MNKKALLYTALTALLCLLVGCGRQKEPEQFEKQALYFDTVIQIRFYADENGEELMQRCMEMCDAMEKTFSRTDSESELYAVNHRQQDTVEVSAGIAELVKVGLDYYEKSGGKFDITIAPLSDLWDFKSEDARVPEAGAIEEALQKVDAAKVHVDGNVLRFDSPDTMIDLGALVKGYAADRLKAYLTSQGVTSGLINLGGNVLAIGTKPDGSNWNIGIQKPFGDYGDSSAVVEVDDQTVVSSGIYERYFEQNGVLYHHILDPDTGYPVQSDIEGVSVISDTSLTGDALSTSCLALGFEEAKELIGKIEGAEAVFVLKDGTLAYTDETMR
ncbi:MAG: FAD:protein FMN transferase [Eubacteriales bacterium]|nr:FAD:protein FMN transferase [Eubacteriales bacterium]